jgi:hypothetical protein
LRRGHRQDAQIRTQRTRRIERQSQRQVIVEAAFVDLVEEHGRHAVELWVGLYSRQKHAVGHHHDARRLADLGVEARCIADGLSRRFAERGRHELGRCPSGEPPRHQQQNLAVAASFAKQGGRNLRRLAGTGRSNEERSVVLPKRRQQVGQDGVDGKGHYFAGVAPGFPR